MSHKKSDWKPADSDGCTGWPDGNWLDCCLEHDESYEAGGSWLERLRADWKLAKCVHRKGKGKRCRACQTVMAGAMGIGVRVLGIGLWPYHHVWGKSKTRIRPNADRNT